MAKAKHKLDSRQPDEGKGLTYEHFLDIGTAALASHKGRMRPRSEARRVLDAIWHLIPDDFIEARDKYIKHLEDCPELDGYG